VPEKVDSKKYVWDEIWRKDPYNEPHERRERARRRLTAIAPLLAATSDLGDVLELGCGDGSFANCVAESADHQILSYLGLDLSPTALGRAQSELRDARFRFELADISKVELRPDSADTIFMLGVLEHLPDPSLVLARLQRVLRLNGRFILTTSNTLSLMYAKRRLREMLDLWPYGYQRNYTPQEFRNLLAQHFVDLAILPMHGDWDFPLATFVDRAAACFDRDFSRYILALARRRTN
jgi:ubiquinone/menaquinone biosynthesis C-methylase UbiE